MLHCLTRKASVSDSESVRRIYNEGIEDRTATLDTAAKTPEEMAEWWDEHDERFVVVVAAAGEEILGWASLNRFSHRCAHAGIADLSVYVARAHRGRGVGFALLQDLATQANEAGFRKIVLHALNENEQGKSLYRKSGFREVGVFKEHGAIDGEYVDVVAMERLLR